MRQVLQNPRSGALELVEVPAPAPGPGEVLVRNVCSVVSPGTDRMAMDFARKSLLGKARSRPDLVRQVARKLKQEGPLSTYRTVTDRLGAPQPLGYSCAGIVEEVGSAVAVFAPGDRVACAGAGYANHAELVVVPENLVVPVPDDLPFDKAAFATLGSIALQGLRVASPELGEVAVVVGLGLIGQLTVQLLRANGCRVLAIDLDPTRVKQALDQGATWGAAPGDDHGPWQDRSTGGHGADLVLVTAAARDSKPIQLAADLSRHKGRVVVVGATAMDLDRRSFYDKELELRMSTSYGPGRYDRRYEELGLDYPYAYVRWTENRNLEAFLQQAAAGAVDPGRLDLEEVPFERAEEAYARLGRGEGRGLGVLFRYPEQVSRERQIVLEAAPREAAADAVGVGFLGAGNYAKAVLLPALGSGPGIRLRQLVTATGASARRTAERFGFAACGTDPEALIADPSVRLVFVATRHDSHAELAERALRAGKAVWLEKPVGLSAAQVEGVLDACREGSGFLAVGYNRRFSPHARALREAFGEPRGPLTIRYRIAAGPPPRGSWVSDPASGGGRIVGEVCHFVDLCNYLADGAPQQHHWFPVGSQPETDDSVVATLRYADGSVATIEYLARASAELPKEWIEVSGDGITAVCDNFRSTRVTGGRGRGLRGLNQDKGQQAAVRAVVEAVRTGRPSPFELEGLAAVSRLTLEMAGLAGDAAEGSE